MIGGLPDVIRPKNCPFISGGGHNEAKRGEIWMTMSC